MNMIERFKILEELEKLRIDVETECVYCDTTGVLRRVYERANEMLDDCKAVIIHYRETKGEN